MHTLLEVIALDAADAEAAQAGGADRLELVAEMSADGLSPDPRVAASVVASTDLPVRAMVRAAAGFAAVDVPELVRTADELIDAGVAGLVLGFLDCSGRVDLEAVIAVADRLDGSPWTFHRAIDHARDYAEAFAEIRELPGLDAVLTAGSPDGVSEGMSKLAGRVVAGDGSLLMAGGGLTASLVPRLRAVGVQAFHIGRTARDARSWARPVSREAVAEWKRITSLPAPDPSSPSLP